MKTYWLRQNQKTQQVLMTLYSSKKTAEENLPSDEEVIEVEVKRILPRKPKADFMSRYKTFEGECGNEEQWKAQAKNLAFKVNSGQSSLDILGLDKVPATLGELKTARNKAMRSNHPDVGGSDKRASEINLAFEILEEMLMSEKPSSTLLLKKPMRAAKLTVELYSKLKFPMYGSPKLDGIRALKSGGVSRTRSFKPVPNDFTRSWIEANLPEGFDGELIIPGADFNTIQSAIMTKAGEPDFRFAAFDYMSGDLKEAYVERYAKLEAKIKEKNDPRLILVQHNLLTNLDELIAYEEECLDLGHEGIMLRSIQGPYKCGESTFNEGFLLKLKRFEDSEGEIIGFEEMFRNDNEEEKDNFGRTKRSKSKEGLVPAGTLGKFKIRDVKHGWELDVGGGPGLTAEIRQEVWDNRDQYLGKLIKYKYQPSGMKNVPRFPGWLGFRDPKDLD